jgi:hypothetical protein
MARGLSAKLPLNISETFGAYDLHTDVKSLVRQNLEMILRTIPGERMMDPEFGVGLEQYLFEPNTDSTRMAISAEIESQIDRYMDFIEVSGIYIDSGEEMGENILSISISYLVIPISEEDILSITL